MFLSALFATFNQHERPKKAFSTELVKSIDMVIFHILYTHYTEEQCRFLLYDMFSFYVTHFKKITPWWINLRKQSPCYTVIQLDFENLLECLITVAINKLTLQDIRYQIWFLNIYHLFHVSLLKENFKFINFNEICGQDCLYEFV